MRNLLNVNGSRSLAGDEKVREHNGRRLVEPRPLVDGVHCAFRELPSAGGKGEIYRELRLPI